MSEPKEEKKKVTSKMLYDEIRRHPDGVPWHDLAQTFNLKKGTKDSRLAALQNQGMLVCEDDRGNIFPFS